MDYDYYQMISFASFALAYSAVTCMHLLTSTVAYTT
jgi:hypothetical protein